MCQSGMKVVVTLLVLLVVPGFFELVDLLRLAKAVRCSPATAMSIKEPGLQKMGKNEQ